MLVSSDALVVALDLSSSSRAADLAPDRATRARLKLARLLEMRQGGQLGLLAFAGSAHVVSPLTHDARTLRRSSTRWSPG
ncbi:VWA domain-containing protein [Alkalisalibacterium limincola]|uniref:VWA domain-containing protein n=1 Tax=Alkalisalibacterium limincola TaxID=2699169 RepID=UPI00164FF0F9|nr:VWA domain-containing protein [Alkalisalibacterium limincola]